MKYDRDRFAANLRAARAKANMSQDELSETTGVTRTSISDYENAMTTPSVEAAHKLACALGTTVSNLISD